jgi:ABC-type polysaccharide/polyol phosphate export permease
MRSSAQLAWRYRGLVGNFAQREMKAKYKGSVLGWTWSLVNPLATLAIYATVFGFFLKFTPPVAGNGELQNFAVYLFTGLVVWNFLFAVVTGSMQSLLGAGPLLRKVYFPPFTPIAGNALAVLAQTGIELGLLVATYVVLDNVGLSIVVVPLLVALLTAFSLGCGLALAMLNARYRDIAYIVAVLLNLMFYAVPIVYPISKVQELYEAHPWLRVYEWNPVTQFVEGFRDALYQLELPSLGRMTYLTVVSVGALVLGWAYFQRAAADVSEEL